jgi:hypothetical protein
MWFDTMHGDFWSSHNVGTSSSSSSSVMTWAAAAHPSKHWHQQQQQQQQCYVIFGTKEQDYHVLSIFLSLISAAPCAAIQEHSPQAQS